MHKISPIFRGGDVHCANNYRPISLSCILSKVLESIVTNRFSKDLILTIFIVRSEPKDVLCKIMLDNLANDSFESSYRRN